MRSYSSSSQSVEVHSTFLEAFREAVEVFALLATLCCRSSCPSFAIITATYTRAASKMADAEGPIEVKHFINGEVILPVKETK
jgi:hypothetical protein